MAQTHKQTHTHTHGHGDSMTNSAQWGRVGEHFNAKFLSRSCHISNVRNLRQLLIPQTNFHPSPLNSDSSKVENCCCGGEHPGIIPALQKGNDGNCPGNWRDLFSDFFHLATTHNRVIKCWNLGTPDLKSLPSLCYTRDSQNCHKAIPLTSVSQSVSQSVSHI